jgi:hypothetical protein
LFRFSASGKVFLNTGKKRQTLWDRLSYTKLIIVTPGVLRKGEDMWPEVARSGKACLSD